MTNTLHLTDGYKLDHRRQYPKGTTLVYSNWTARGSRMPQVDKVIFFGLQYFLKKYLQEDFENNFFSQPKSKIAKEYTRRINAYLGDNTIGSKHLEALHDLGYLPLKIKALPEGSRVNLRVPMLTIQNTDERFFWLTNYIETMLSASLWLPCTSATIADQYRTLFDCFSKKTSTIDWFTDFQGHDFSMRGMGSLESSMLSGAAHMTSFLGTDTFPAIDFLEQYYNANANQETIGISVPATEHSVMCMGTKKGEKETFRRIFTDLYPTGIVSIVSDTWNLWEVVGTYLSEFKDEIISREGKVVIRPDSGNPVKILTGYTGEEDSEGISELEKKGVVECLWDIFGGTVNKKGYKELDEHIGVIYGDAITLKRAKKILKRLQKKGFASTNVVFGIGSYTYQYNTRDTFAFAIKSTYGEINGEGVEIFKNPKTDDGQKKSAKGLLKVDQRGTTFVLYDQVSKEEEGQGALKTVFCDGKIINELSLSDIRNRISSLRK